MGKTVNVIGGLKGKVGNFVYQIRRGVQIARVYQPVVANPNTKRQELSRSKMALAGEVCRSMLLGLRAAHNLRHPGYEYQQGVAIMVPVSGGIIDGTTPGALTVQYTSLGKILGNGPLPQPSCGVLDFEEESEISFDVTLDPACYLDNNGSAIKAGVVTVVYQPDTNMSHVEFLEVPTAGAHAHIEVPTTWSGLKVHVYCFAKQIPEAVNGIATVDVPWKYPAETSKTVYAGTGNIA